MIGCSRLPLSDIKDAVFNKLHTKMENFINRLLALIWISPLRGSRCQAGYWYQVLLLRQCCGLLCVCVGSAGPYCLCENRTDPHLSAEESRSVHLEQDRHYEWTVNTHVGPACRDIQEDWIHEQNSCLLNSAEPGCFFSCHVFIMLY